MITKVEDAVQLNSSIAIIPLTHGKFAIVDPDLHRYLNQFCWRAVKSKSNWYAVRRVTVGKRTITIKMHREIAHTPEDQVCHHCNGDSLDERRQNLKNMYPLEHTVHHQIYRHNHPTT